MPSLESVEFLWLDVSGTALQQLGQMPNLKQVRVYGCPEVTEADAAQLAVALTGSPAIEDYWPSPYDE